MSKPVKLAVCIFVGLDIFVVGYIALSQLRFMVFGQGQIPGGGSALDMALFLLPLFLAWVAGDRLYYFLSYPQRKAARLSRTTPVAPPVPSAYPTAGTYESIYKKQSEPVAASVWEDRGWSDDEPEPENK